MRFLKFSLAMLSLAMSATLSIADTNEFDPPALYLQWQRDPTTTMTIHWHTVGEAATQLFFRKAGDSEWHAASGSEHPFPGTDRMVHVVELTALTSDSRYEFCFLPGQHVYSFRTMPADLSRPVRFVTGGDVFQQRDWLDAMNLLAAKQDPAFILFGGDMAYSCDATNSEKMARWFDYLDSWKHKAVAPDGRLIPMLVTMGNHEVRGSYLQPVSNAKGFYSLFSFPGGQGYACLDFGKYLSLVLLDSDHTHPIAGDQTKWLGRQLAARRGVPHVIPIYHTPAYPGFREFDGKQAVQVRTNWCPLFDKYGVKLVFENHDHVFKHTLPIRANKIDPDGTVYLGDGAWGVPLRKPDATKPRWYLAANGSVRHFYVVTLYKESRHVLGINEAGEVFDELYQRVKR